MNAFNPEMMILARERQGLSQSALARAIGVTQATISRYEAGLVEPLEEHLRSIAETLGRPKHFFYLDESLFGASSMFHRKRKSLSVKDEKRIHAQVNELRIRTALLLREAEIVSQAQFHRIDATTSGPEVAAQAVRHLWQLPIGPIRSVVGAIERAGGVVFDCEFETDKVDGISQWPLGHDGTPPVFFVRDDCPGDRQRWTLAHELGHVVMHHMPSDDPEREADMFAAEFLMPAREIASELNRLTLQKAAALKCYWKVSMAAIVWRAYTLEKITERQYRYFNTQMSMLGYRKCEPAPIPREEPRLFDEVMRMHRRSHGRTIEQLACMLGMYEEQFRAEYWQTATGLRIA